MLNQLFSFGTIVMHLEPCGNLIGAKLIVQWRHLINCSALVLNWSFNCQVLPLRSYLPSFPWCRVWIGFLLWCLDNWVMNPSDMGIFSKWEYKDSIPNSCKINITSCLLMVFKHTSNELHSTSCCMIVYKQLWPIDSIHNSYKLDSTFLPMIVYKQSWIMDAICNSCKLNNIFHHDCL